MPTKRIGDELPPNSSICTHPEHLPPMHQVFKPGYYQHTCPACKHKTFFNVRGPVW